MTFSFIDLLTLLDILLSFPAAAVTAWARMRLFRLIRAIHKHGGKVAYVDTDSVKCNIDVLNTPALRKEFMWDGTGDELGSLKNECNEEMEKAVKKAKKAGSAGGSSPRVRRAIALVRALRNARHSFSTSVGRRGARVWLSYRGWFLGTRTYRYITGRCVLPLRSMAHVSRFQE